MPYKNPLQKKEWEQQHRPQRLARRHELRRIAKSRQEVRPESASAQSGGVGFLFPLVVAGSAFALYEPRVAVGAGGLTLILAALYKKGSSWWILGIVILAIGLFAHVNDLNTEK
jgi:hypothetical protein